MPVRLVNRLWWPILIGLVLIFGSASAASATESTLTRVWGDPAEQPTVVLIHGMASDAGIWADFITALGTGVPELGLAGWADRYCLYTFEYDWRRSIADNGADFKRLIEAEGLVEPTLIAHSMGGIVARQYLALGGGFTRLVTLGTPHFGSPLAGWTYLLTVGGESILGQGPQDIDWISPKIIELFHTDQAGGYPSRYVLFSGELTGTEQQLGPIRYYTYDHDYPALMIAASGLVSGRNDGLVKLNSALYCLTEPAGACATVAERHLTAIDHLSLTEPRPLDEGWSPVLLYLLSDFEYAPEWNDDVYCAMMGIYSGNRAGDSGSLAVGDQTSATENPQHPDQE